VSHSELRGVWGYDSHTVCGYMQLDVVHRLGSRILRTKGFSDRLFVWKRVLIDENGYKNNATFAQVLIRTE